ncbi:MAG TPA: hypothetical protein VHH55_02780 [Gaiellaceae bacterium]|nr:hypothetical protein [Gaiellaceae bacterium]
MDELLRRSVSLHGIRVGQVVDVILARGDETVLGFEILCEDGRHRFLPAAASTVTDDAVVVDSPFALLDTDQLDFYRARGVALRGGGETAA